jgi:hypothetical protein
VPNRPLQVVPGSYILSDRHVFSYKPPWLRYPAIRFFARYRRLASSGTAYLMAARLAVLPTRVIARVVWIGHHVVLAAVKAVSYFRVI